MVDMRVTDVARLGVRWRSGRSRADLIRGVVMLGSLAVATGGAIALARELPAWRGRQSVTEAARLIAGGDRGAAAAGGAPQAALRGDPLASGDGAPARRRHERHGPRIHRGPAAGSLRPARRARTTGTQRKEHPMKRWIVGTPALALAAALVAGLPRVGLTKPHAPLWSERPATSGASVPAASPWVELARALKPAVVNISTKRVEEGWRPPEGPLGQNDPY